MGAREHLGTHWPLGAQGLLGAWTPLRAQGPPPLSLWTFVGPRTLEGPGMTGAHKPFRAQQSLGAKGLLVYQGLVGTREHKEH
jgi:hypothetical protein